MTQATPTADGYDRFAAVAGEYGIEPKRVPPDEVAETIDELATQPAVGTPLPWDGVTLPESVTAEPTMGALEEASTGVTAASFAVASYGSLVLETDHAGSEPVSLFNDLHIAVVREDDIVPDMAAAIDRLGDDLRAGRSSAVIATGPSATADMGALVQGAHGPRRVEVLVVT
ncbi:L-lactate dehydrogenase complex protein LldG [Halovenus aranensis]|uniref:L-lactate dehydrogenase complex protein LldG n=1 Tax=Halovenus aranensis TaxID=890420 RepID=A0A1G8XQZ6_9EURY|nr:LUD domain-containing protein [Halovenus aranensis]SDJ93092.1 L-lactate dehydrogenase complex protein LldG [Halovenus aranensis]